MKNLLTKRNLLIAGILLVVAIGIPLTLLQGQKQQEIRQHAAESTTLTFSPSSSSSSPIVKTVGNSFDLDVMVNPGSNSVSLVRYQISYDDPRLILNQTTPVTINTDAFPAVLEGPIISGGKISGTVSIGSNYSKAITVPTKVLTIHFVANEVTGTTPTQVSYTSLSQVLSTGSNDQAAENVLSSTQPAYIMINGVATPTPTRAPTPTFTPTPTPTKIPTPTPTRTATPTPTPLPPTLTLTANPISVPYNSSSTLQWSTTNATGCTATGAWSGSMGISGTQSTGNLTSSKTYTLTCTGPGGSITKSVTVTVGAAPTSTPVPTATPVPLATKFAFTIFMHGIGHSGDNANPTAYSLSNQNPVHSQWTLNVEVLNSSGQVVLTKSGMVAFNATNGYFTGTIDMGTSLSTGQYNIKVKNNQYLKRLIPGIQSITAGTTNAIPQATLVTGDVNNDNKLDILDYNIIVGCYSDFAPPLSCTQDQKYAADLTDDGNVNQFDYNLFLRDLSVQNGN